MKKLLATIAMLAIPGMAMAIGLVGDCYDCHTMHNSENGGNAVAQIGTATGTAAAPGPIENLLKFDCMACHANNPSGGSALWVMTGGSVVPQVAHNAASDLAGGNFSYGIATSGASANASITKVHNVKELFAGQVQAGPATGNPPGMVEFTQHSGGVFTTTTQYDDFSCSGARGCHGTRFSLDNASGAELVGMAAISGAHHQSFDGAKTDGGYIAAGGHDGATVAAGFRFIPGLNAYGNEANRWQNTDASHNEYYGSATALGAGCSTCHNGITRTSTSSMKVPNNSMSGFCSTCHGMFHSAGTGAAEFQAAAPGNGTSGAFLRHPSDFVIPNEREYAAYTTYDVSAPVARPSVFTTDTTTAVNPGTDMVMCLSCHQAHGSDNDYILRFDYTAMTAGTYANQAAAQAVGGCLACHTLKGVQQ